jgi:DNA-directed RNA polymerase specialized sigma24 family protein
VSENGTSAPGESREGSTRRPSRLDRDVEAASERLARLEADRDLIETLRSEGFTGRNFVYFQTVLAQYGVAVIRAWIRDGKVLGKYAEKGFGGLPPEPRPGALTDDLSTGQGIADETVARALNAFRDKVLVPGRWDPKRGASLRTFFVGQCLMQFGNVYRSWHTDCSRELAESYDDTSLYALMEQDRTYFSTTLESSERAAVRKDAVRRLIAHVADEQAREALWLNVVVGIPYRQIAERFNMTDKKMEHMIARARAQIAGAAAR